MALRPDTPDRTAHLLRSTAALAAGAFILAVTSMNAIAAPPQVIATEQHRIAVTTAVGGLDSPWSLAFLPDGRWLVTEKPGRLRVVEFGPDGAARLVAAPVAGLPPVRASGQGGLLDVTPHPGFAQNRLIYWSYSAGGGDIGTEVARGELKGGAGEAYRLEKVEVIFRQQPKVSGGRHFGSRLVWDRSGNLFVSLGDRGDQDQAQNTANHLGTVVRITDAGKVPADNPFARGTDAAGRPVLPEIYSFGNRNVQGAALNPATGELWAHEHGPQGGDEVNIIRAGRNYGWPVITYGVNYGIGTKIGEGTAKPGMEQPLWRWVPSIAPSGMSFYAGSRFPGWKGSLFVGALKDMSLVRLTLEGNSVVREERIRGLGRLRDVREGPDGNLYVVSESEGAILRLEPAR